MHASLTESGPVCEAQRLNVSCDHLEVKRERGGRRRRRFGFEPIRVRENIKPGNRKSNTLKKETSNDLPLKL